MCRACAAPAAVARHATMPPLHLSLAAHTIRRRSIHSLSLPTSTDTGALATAPHRRLRDTLTRTSDTTYHHLPRAAPMAHTWLAVGQQSQIACSQHASNTLGRPALRSSFSSLAIGPSRPGRPALRSSFSSLAIGPSRPGRPALRNSFSSLAIGPSRPFVLIFQSIAPLIAARSWDARVRLRAQSIQPLLRCAEVVDQLTRQCQELERRAHIVEGLGGTVAGRLAGGRGRRTGIR